MKLKDNKIFRAIIIPICLILCFVGQFIPSVGDFSSEAFGVLFIFLGTLILWLTIGIDWPSLLCICALGFIRVFKFNDILVHSFGDSTFLFLLFTFICTYALSKTSLIKKVAIKFVDNKFAKKNSYIFIFMFLFSTLLLGLFISPSVLFIVLLPILQEILKVANIEKNDKISKALMLGLGFSVSISSGMTTISHVFPILAMEAANIEISHLTYSLFAIPTGLIIFLLTYFLLILIIRPDPKKLTNLDFSEINKSLPRITAKEITILVVFFLVILLWILPSIFRPLSEEFYNAINKYGTVMPPILGTLVLSIIRIKNEPIIDLGDAFKNGVPWSSLIMCAATLAIGYALKSDAIGLSAFLEKNLGMHLQNMNQIGLLIIFVVWAALQTNLSSNMVTATLVASVAASILSTIELNINFNAVICIIGMMASFAFATPSSMPHIAMVAGSESCNTKDVLLFGSLTMVVAIIISLLIGYPIAMLIC